MLSLPWRLGQEDFNDYKGEEMRAGPTKADGLNENSSYRF
jgi:hypothetical protein